MNNLATNGGMPASVQSNLITPRQKVETMVSQVIASGITILCDKTWYIMLPGGTYDILHRSDRGSTGMGVLRQAYEDTWQEKPTWREITEALGHFHQYQPTPPTSVRIVDTEDFNKQPLYRLKDDGRIFRLGTRFALSVAEVSETLTLEDQIEEIGIFDNVLQNPDNKLMWQQVIQHYGPNWFSLVAWLMLTPRKAICVITAPRSSAGKSTFVDMLAGAFPNWIVRDDADEVFRGQKSQFPPLNKFLTQARLVFLDEAEKIETPPSARLVNSMTNTTMTVKEKHIIDMVKTRTGNVCFIGSGDPNLELGQGSDTRFQWKIEALDMEVLPDGLRDWMLSEPGLQFTRYNITLSAIGIWEEGDSYQIPGMGRELAQAMVENLTDDILIFALKRLCASGQESDKVSNSDIQAAIKESYNEVELPERRAWGKVMRETFPQAIPCLVGHPSKRGYRRLRLRTKSELEALETMEGADWNGKV